MAEKWLSIVEYARDFNISDMTVRRRIKTGKLNAVLKEGKYYIPVNGHSNSPGIQKTPVFPDSPSRHLGQTHEVPTDQNKSLYGRASTESVKSREITTNLNNSNVEGIHTPSLTSKDVDIDPRSLFEFCQSFLSQQGQLEANISAKYDNQLRHLQSEIQVRDLKINDLMQQVEDLSVLVKLLEKKTRL